MSSKSKVGRNRIYSNEQRKDRNRKAQAAFRVRQHQYTKDLEAALLELETRLTDLKTTNNQLEERAQSAETKCLQLSLEVDSLHKLLGIAIAGNQQADLSVNYVNKPLSPIDSTLSISSPESLFDLAALDYSWLNTDVQLAFEGILPHGTWHPQVNPKP